MNARILMGLAGLLGALAVVLGAFGAHALRARLSPDLLAIWRTGVEYHFYHVFALIAVAVLASSRPSAWLSAAGWLFLAGIVVFSGSLYALTLSGVRVLGAITPIGGLAFIAGWICFAIAAFSKGEP